MLKLRAKCDISIIFPIKEINIHIIRNEHMINFQKYNKKNNQLTIN